MGMHISAYITLSPRVCSDDRARILEHQLLGQLCDITLFGKTYHDAVIREATLVRNEAGVIVGANVLAQSI